MPREEIIFPPSHITLGLMKLFVKGIDETEQFFQYILLAFPGLSSEKLKAGVFDDPQILKLIKEPNLQHSMNKIELAGWLSFLEVVQCFLGNRKADNYKDIIQKLLDNFQALGINMNIKVHFLHSRLDRFPENLGDVNDEPGERFPRGIKLWKRDIRVDGTKK